MTVDGSPSPPADPLPSVGDSAVTQRRSWRDIAPQDATEINLAVRLDIDAPVNEMGERCPWPWEPQQLVGVPMGQYHCGYCGAMCVAGVPHPDYANDGPTP